MLLRRAPPAPLAPFIECLWMAEREALPHARERCLPSGCADIVIPLLPRQQILRYDGEHTAEPRRLCGGVLQGPHDRASVRGVEGPSAVVGVHFRPGGAAAWFGAALPELRNRTLALDELWGTAAHSLRDQLQNAPTPQAVLQRLEAHLWRRLRDAPAADTMVLQAIGALQRDPANARIEPVQRASGCTAAQFIRRFERMVGLTPKRYARVLRFHSMLPQLVRAGPRDWAQIAVAAGYFDQSHLVHEFRRLSGLTPTAYRPVQPDQPTHVALPR